MKLRKLIPAFALLLVSAVVMSTASFAWFSMNTKVEVSSMTVKATASKNLLISDTKEGTYLASLKLDVQATSMVPTSTVASSTPSFFKLDKVGTNMQADKSDASWDSVFVAATPNTDYIKQTMWVQATGTDASNLKATISFTGVTADLDPALRVLIINSTNAYLYTPVSGADASYNAIATIYTEEEKVAPSAATKTCDASNKAIAGVVYYTDPDCANEDSNVAVGDDVSTKYVKIPAGAIKTTTATSTYATNGSTVVVGTLKADTPTQIDVYIWYEGQDSNCKSTNAVDLSTLVFSIVYSCD